MPRLDLESVKEDKFRTNCAVTCVHFFLAEEHEWDKDLVE